MARHLCGGLAALLSSSALAAPQNKASSELKVKVSVRLVQMDAVVTDAHGNHVTNLSRDDFEVLLDGKPQTLKTFDVVIGDVLKSGSPAPKEKSSAPAESPDRGAPIKPSDVRRTLVLFVDDLSLSADRVPAIRKALHDLVDRQMQPGDLVSIVRASAGLGALRDFTTDKNLLSAAADQIRWNSSGKGGMRAYDNDRDFSTSAAEQETRLRAEYFATAVVDSLRRLVGGMADLPGRKSVIILSNSLPMKLAEYDNGLGLNTENAAPNLENLGSMGERMLRLADAATRASVVFYAVDTRLLASARELQDEANPILSGVFTNNQAVSPAGYGIKLGGAGDSRVSDLQIGNSDYRLQRTGGIFLSSQTGGFTLYDTNDISYAISKVLNDSVGYYLLGFAPPDETFERGTDGKPKFHRVTVRVRKPELHVRSRSGFYGVSDRRAIAPVEGGPLMAALESPFRSDGIGLDLKCAFVKAGRNLPSIRASMIVRAQGLTLEGPVYNRSAIIHLMIKAYGVNGADLDRSADKLLRVSLNEEGYRRAMRFGLVYAMEVEVAKPGPYRVRVALSDEASGRVGTASQYLVVPNLSGHKLTLSGLMFPGSYGTDDDIVPAPEPIAYAPGSSSRFAFEVFGAHDNSKKLLAQTRLFRDGAQVYEGTAKPLEVASKVVHGEAVAKDDLAIPRDLPPGDYEIQEEVTEETSGHRMVRASQWAELHIAGGE